MTLYKRFSIFFIALLMAGALGCAATETRQSTSEYVDDSWITTKVKSEIFAEPSLKVAQVNVETYQGVVQLSGFVASKADMAKAVEVARAVKGVKSVKNDMRLR
ncbi:MAG TPA: BON domain-containing protein [Burkholderiales bacterium]